MKLISLAKACAGLLSVASVNAINQQEDIFYNEKSALGPSMWHFNPNGLTIYAPDGEVLKEHRKKALCGEYANWRGEMKDTCSWFTAATDGHRYVWAAGMHGEHRIAAFDIDTGDHAGDQSTCSTPLDMEYQPSRREMWVRCAQKSGGDEFSGEIDVFSSGNLGADQDMIFLNITSRPYGRIAMHSDMGPFGYVTSYNYPSLSEIDLSKKSVSAEYKIEDASGSYASSYSAVNHHLFGRTRICCSCGTPTSDIESCGRGANNVTVKTGPNMSPNAQPGSCGTGCLGSGADTIGVFEFDTINKEFVATHNILAGTGFGSDPFATPDGKYILLMPNDGGQYVRVLRPGLNGVPSKVEKDIPLNFQGGTPGKMVIADFAYVSDRGILVLAASTDNDIVLVDFEANFATARLNLSPGANVTAGGFRQVEWARGTNYVWVDGSEMSEHYIIDIPNSGIADASIVRTIADTPGGKLIYVNNYERARTFESIAASTYVPDDKITTSPTSIAAVVVGSIALLSGLYAIFASRNKPFSIKTDGGADDTVSLGSKNMN